jgi:hypothetical protein
MSLKGTEKPDKFALPLPEVQHETKLRDTPRRHHLVIQIIVFVVPLQLVRVIVALKKDMQMTFWRAQTQRRVTPLEEVRAHKLIKDYIMCKRGDSKFVLRAATHDEEPVPRKLIVASIMLLLSFLGGGLAYKILRATHDLDSGNAFFAIAMGLGCIPILIAGGVLAVCKQRVLNNTLWIATTVLGLGMIALSSGYIVGYID